MENDILRNELIKARPFESDKPYIFISYRHADYELVWRDVIELKNRNLNIWIDCENVNGWKFDEQEDWSDQAIPALKKAESVIVYFSKNAFNGTGFAKECKYLQTHSDKKYFSFFIGFDPKETNIERNKEIENIIRKLKNEKNETVAELEERKTAYRYITRCGNQLNYYINYETNHTHLNHYDFQNTLKYNHSFIDNNSIIEWTKESAKTWISMKAPSRPSACELEIYREYFKKVKAETSSTEKPKVLILGSTAEFRKIAFDEGFSVFVVDYSKDYYNEISKEIETNILDAEIYIQADWCNMSDHLKEEYSKFNIIIGDLAIGNIPPERLSDFFKNISLLLSPNGFFLGKSVYKYSNYTLTKENLMKQLLEAAEDSSITKDNLYEHIMYPLSIFAGTFDEKNGYQEIDFSALYEIIKEFNEKYNSEITPEDKFSIYLDESTRFDKKMPKHFYIYSYNKIFDNLDNNELFIDDVRYGNDTYKDFFPLLIIKKGKPLIDNTMVTSFIDQADENIKKEWSNSITALHFIKSILSEDGEDDDTTWELFGYIKDIMSKARIEINEKYNFFLSDIPITNMQEETDVLTDVASLNEEEKKLLLSEEEKKSLQFNYTCGLLINLLKKETENNPNIHNYLLDFVVRTLMSRCKAGKWEPEGVPWMSARICICLFPLYEEWMKECENSKYEGKNRKYIEKVQRVVTQLADKRKGQDFWVSEKTNNDHFDTSALCLEMLNLYKKYIDGLDKKIDEICNIHVNNNKIRETLVKYPIGDSLIQDVLKGTKINGKPAYKKLCGRISWYSMLYIFAQGEEKEYLGMQLKAFCYKFRNNYNELIDSTHSLEIGLIPQILYSLKRTSLFGS